MINFSISSSSPSDQVFDAQLLGRPKNDFIRFNWQPPCQKSIPNLAEMQKFLVTWNNHIRQLAALFRLNHWSTKTWWHRQFAAILAITDTNSLLAYNHFVRLTESPMSLLEFRRLLPMLAPNGWTWSRHERVQEAEEKVGWPLTCDCTSIHRCLEWEDLGTKGMQVHPKALPRKQISCPGSDLLLLQSWPVLVRRMLRTSPYPLSIKLLNSVFFNDRWSALWLLACFITFHLN